MITVFIVKAERTTLVKQRCDYFIFFYLSAAHQMWEEPEAVKISILRQDAGLGELSLTKLVIL